MRFCSIKNDNLLRKVSASDRKNTEHCSFFLSEVQNKISQIKIYKNSMLSRLFTVVLFFLLYNFFQCMSKKQNKVTTVLLCNKYHSRKLAQQGPMFVRGKIKSTNKSQLKEAVKKPLHIQEGDNVLVIEGNKIQIENKTPYMQETGDDKAKFNNENASAPVNENIMKIRLGNFGNNIPDTQNPNVPQFGNIGIQNPNIPQFGNVGIQNPNVPQFGNFGNQNPSIPQSEIFGNQNPNVPQFGNIGIQNPNVPQFGNIGIQNPSVPQFGNLGIQNPNVPQFGNLGIQNPNVPQFGNIGIQNPSIPQFGSMGNSLPMRRQNKKTDKNKRENAMDINMEEVEVMDVTEQGFSDPTMKINWPVFHNNARGNDMNILKLRKQWQQTVYDDWKKNMA
ncbi:Plasmodium exported protein, unknown function [Plasmodium gallinaceum]|uniref:Uncharacterized protein n=1 Tax=Plasmodium gallinaceum TaxID=5849 RepID=A0A1J1H0W8_PLAGA|nr:Plasmodium exported protein, unknown function [Plasmodium gallinaceum]CRG97178.1 Plasmodium exported protein, unknown function [Plasmodium gallinaceum]